MSTYERFAIKLAEQKKAIVSELETIATHDSTTDDWITRTDDIKSNETDNNLCADNAEETDERVAILVELETLYRNINCALKKIVAGKYGNCEICNTPIEVERLEVNPSARTCVVHENNEIKLPLA